MNKYLFKALVKDFGPVLFRNLFSIVTVIIGGLSIILIVLGNKRDGVFLGSVISINIIVGIIQELRAKINLERLQLSTKQHYSVVRNNKELTTYSEEILPGDKIQLRLGDQVPVDSKIISCKGFECNLALLTGETENVSKQTGENLLSGTIVVAGEAKIIATKSEKESYLYKMNEDLKKYQTSYSPIQKAILRFIKIMAFILLIMAIIILSRSIITKEPLLSGFVQIAALASTIIAEGLLLASTILFAYGAIKLAKQKVLLQQINAIEGLGRVSIVCIDKTGTITETNPVYEKTTLFDSSDHKKISKILSTYTINETSHTTTLNALKSKYNDKDNTYQIEDILAFSSERKYSAIRVSKTNKVFLIGAAEKFLNALEPEEKQWVEEELSSHSMLAKRLIFVAEADMEDVKKISSIKKIKAIGFVIFKNPLKAGSIKTIKALQERGVQIVVISGDNAQTVKAISQQAGIEFGDEVVSGEELDKLHPDEIMKLINRRVIFARTLPSQKQKIVDSIKLSNQQVAMIGDGANDATAIKAADVGIAMFSGAPATRQIADAVLTNNSFAAIPKGIKLSDTIITTLEMIGCLFFTRVWSGLFLLLTTLLVRVDYPLQPRNITLLNIFIVALPIMLWLSYPRHRNRKLNDPSYLSRTLPFSILNALVIAISSLISILLIGKLGIASSQIPMAVFIIFFIMSIYSIGLIPRAIGAEEDKNQQRLIYIGYVLAAVILAIIYFIPALSKFFDLSVINLKTLIISAGIGYIGTAIQYIFVKFSVASKLWLRLITK